MLTPGPPQDRPPYTPSGQRYDYRIALEPYNQRQRWLPALDYPAGPVPEVRFTRDFRALSHKLSSGYTQFILSAYPHTKAGIDEAPWMLDQARSLPAHGNPQARKLAARLKAETPERTVEQILAWFTEGEFTYTLQPPLLDESSIDFFLFDTRKGFCEHFAGAFVFLARATGIPARVVTGYQGGRVNPVNGALTVRQSDAHAWTEVWFAGSGWVRVDPTALIAPQRIEEGLGNSLSESELLPFMLQPRFRLLRQLRDRWETIAAKWSRLVISYDNRQQRNLLDALGLDASSLPTLLGSIAIATALLLAALYYWALRRHTVVEPLDRAWARFSAKLARQGLARAPSEGPLDYGRRLAAARPANAGALTAICTDYARLRYRPPASHQEICKLIHSVARLDLKEETPKPR
jgi:transglutaminase-like putative cysteine protease